MMTRKSGPAATLHPPEPVSGIHPATRVGQSQSLSGGTWIDALVAASDVIMVASPVGARCEWRDGRIWTSATLAVRHRVAGHLPVDRPARVTARGGCVGAVGHFVDGEASLFTAWPSLFFLARTDGGAFEVVNGACGQFPLVSSDDRRRFVPSPWRSLPSRPPRRANPFEDVSPAVATRELSLHWMRVHERC